MSHAHHAWTAQCCAFWHANWRPVTAFHIVVSQLSMRGPLLNSHEDTLVTDVILDCLGVLAPGEEQARGHKGCQQCLLWALRHHAAQMPCNTALPSLKHRNPRQCATLTIVMGDPRKENGSQ